MRGKIGFFVVVAMALLMVGGPAFAQVGIFDKSTDWYSPESPRGTVKVAGNATFEGGLYTLQGNGDDIWNNDDEGFFLYTEKAGDWRLSARVRWNDPGTNDWSKIGVMIREKATLPGSRHYWSDLRGAAYGDRVDTQWRTTENSSSGNVQIFEDPPTNSVALQADADGYVWLRVTRISSIGMLFSEWSRDGKTWNLSHSTTVTGWADSVAYGLAITNHVDDDYLVEATADNVVLEPAPSVTSITRSLSSRTFKAGQALNATLKIFYTGSTATNLTVTETIPPGFTVSDISNNGAFADGKITWNITAQPGSTNLTYKVTASSTYDPKTLGYGASFVGSGGSFDIEGLSTVYYFNVTVGDKLFSFDFENASQYDSWEQLAGYWDIIDGKYYEIEDADGPLVTLTGDPGLTDVSITVDAMGLVGDADWGIVFRATDISNFYSWQFVNGALELLSYVGGTRTTLYTEPYAEALNVWQKFQVIAQGNVFYLLFDGEIHAVYEDDALAAGQIGFFGWINSGTAIAENSGGIAYDNLVVSALATGTDISLWSLY